ncbi:MAG: polyprenyl synthetase family protein [Rhodospirillaceae bacterium]|nr:polyprenyl synthetase family protein [Rhodospirillaceae bacterium]
MDSPVAVIPQLAGYIVASGGKRLRPLLTLASARLSGYAGSRQVALATAVEFIHTATLLHDDVVDESAMRRGKPSANDIFGNKSSVLVGDFLFARAFRLMVEDGSLAVLDTLSNAAAVIAEGEVLQLSAAHDTETTEDTYLEVIHAKTAELFAAACEVGGLVAGRAEADVAALRSFGMNLGVAFQLVDDVLDYSALQARLGKSVGDDFRDGKMTLPVVLAFQAGSEDERAFWRRTMEEQEIAEGDLDHAIALLRRHAALDRSVAMARRYAADAQACLARFEDGPMRQALHDVVDFCVDRDY